MYIQHYPIKVALVFASIGEPLKPLALIWQALTAANNFLGFNTIKYKCTRLIAYMKIQNIKSLTMHANAYTKIQKVKDYVLFTIP